MENFQIVSGQQEVFNRGSYLPIPIFVMRRGSFFVSKVCWSNAFIKGVRVSIHSPWILHLLFVDDCIIFSKASQRGAD
jgi:hypothetical protein